MTTSAKERLAIIGSGIAGLTAAYRLQNSFDITLFEAESWVGGHTHTVEVPDGPQHTWVDTGFIVFNHWTYPNFIQLLTDLGVAYQPSNMSFSLQCSRSGLEYNGTSLNTLFAQRHNLVSASFWRLLLQILQFNKRARELANSPDSPVSFGDWLEREQFHESLIDYYLLPLGRSIWSASRQRLLAYPAQFYARFFERHGFLNIVNRPRWQTVSGGSKSYVDALLRQLSATVHKQCPVIQIDRTPSAVFVTTAKHEQQSFDGVIIATHADTALRILGNPTAAEQSVLRAFPYEDNDVVLHSDVSLLPTNRRARAAWNYYLGEDHDGPSTLTYDMNVLQNLATKTPFLVSLNQTSRINPKLIHARYNYAHPQYTPAGVAAQAKHAEISGVNRTFYCGAYWGSGFHEDGVNSALTVVNQLLNSEWRHAQRHL
jgi:uncharacterized protein